MSWLGVVGVPRKGTVGWQQCQASAQACMELRGGGHSKTGGNEHTQSHQQDFINLNLQDKLHTVNNVHFCTVCCCYNNSFLKRHSMTLMPLCLEA